MRLKKRGRVGRFLPWLLLSATALLLLAAIRGEPASAETPDANLNGQPAVSGVVQGHADFSTDGGPENHDTLEVDTSTPIAVSAVNELQGNDTRRTPLHPIPPNNVGSAVQVAKLVGRNCPECLFTVTGTFDPTGAGGHGGTPPTWQAKYNKGDPRVVLTMQSYYVNYGPSGGEVDVSVADGDPGITYSVTLSMDNQGGDSGSVDFDPVTVSVPPDQSVPVTLGGTALGTFTIKGTAETTAGQTPVASGTTQGEVVASPLVLTSEVISHFTPSEPTIGSPASVTFRVHMYCLDPNGNQIPAPTVNSETFTVDAGGGGGTIQTIANTAGLPYVISGETAVLSGSAPISGTSFDVTVTFIHSTPGVKMVTITGSAQYQDANGGEAATMSGSSSHGRDIEPAANPGPVAVPGSIYCINDENFGGGDLGHNATIIPDPTGCTYYSYGPDGHVKAMHYNNIQDALACAKAAGYTREEHWKCNAQQAATARAAAMGFDGTPYRLKTHNCWHMAFGAISSTNVNVDFYDYECNSAFDWNTNNADGWSHL